MQYAILAAALIAAVGFQIYRDKYVNQSPKHKESWERFKKTIGATPSKHYEEDNSKRVYR